MAIVKMKRLRLIAMRQEQEGLLEALQHLGCVEISRPDADVNSPEWTGLSHPDSAALNQARNEGAAIAAALAALKEYAAEKRPMFAPRPTVGMRDLFDDGAYAAALELADYVVTRRKQVDTLRAQQTKLISRRASLVPWLPLDVPLNTPSTEQVNVQFGSIPSRQDFDLFTAAVMEAAPPAQIIPASSDGEAHYFLLLCHTSAMEGAAEVLREYSFSPAVLKGWVGTALQCDQLLERELKHTEGMIASAEEQITRRSHRQAELERAADRAAQDLKRQEAKSRLLDTDSAFLLEGWFPAEEESRLSAVLAPFTCVWETAEPTEEDYPSVPVKLKNNRFTRPLNMVTDMYVYPAYDGLDPNPFMAPFFVFFFGLMMADMAYGLMMLAAGWFLVKKLKAKGTMGHMGGLMLLCGTTTFLFGALTGGFFGDFIPQLAKIINPESTFQLPYLFTPLTDTLAVLIGSLILGAIQVITGMIISFVKKIKDGDIADAIWSELTWWIILGGGALAIFGIGSVGGVPVVLVIGALMLVYGSGRNAKGFGKVTALIGAVYNGVTGYFSDILSYARLMALMLAGAVIAQVFNTLGSVTGNVVTFVIISLLGNMVNFALNLLGCYVHDLRLQCLEFFGRFYKEGGKPFKPLSVETKYVDIIKEEK